MLVEGFNVAAADGVMCRNTVNVGWDGRVFDCDFNQQLDMGIRYTERLASILLTRRRMFISTQILLTGAWHSSHSVWHYGTGSGCKPTFLCNFCAKIALSVAPDLLCMRD